MTGPKSHDASEAMIDETLAESFPASDSPGWTLGVDDAEGALAAPKGSRYVTRDAILKLLTDEEIAHVATLEDAESLGVGEEYLDLAHVERGVLRVQVESPPDMAHVLPRSALSEESWARVLSEARRGWERTDTE